MNKYSVHKSAKLRRIIKAKSKLTGESTKPRICVFRSNKNVYVQAIDDESQKTITAFSSLNLDKKVKHKKNIKVACVVAEEFSKRLKDKGIKKAVFDRRWYKYHGIVKTIAEGLRAGGLKI